MPCWGEQEGEGASPVLGWGWFCTHLGTRGGCPCQAPVLPQPHRQQGGRRPLPILPTLHGALAQLCSELMGLVPGTRAERSCSPQPLARLCPYPAAVQSSCGGHSTHLVLAGGCRRHVQLGDVTRLGPAVLHFC